MCEITSDISCMPTSFCSDLWWVLLGEIHKKYLYGWMENHALRTDSFQLLALCCCIFFTMKTARFVLCFIIQSDTYETWIYNKLQLLLPKFMVFTNRRHMHTCQVIGQAAVVWWRMRIYLPISMRSKNTYIIHISISNLTFMRAIACHWSHQSTAQIHKYVAHELVVFVWCYDVAVGRKRLRIHKYIKLIIFIYRPMILLLLLSMLCRLNWLDEIDMLEFIRIFSRLRVLPAHIRYRWNGHLFWHFRQLNIDTFFSVFSDT